MFFVNVDEDFGKELTREHPDEPDNVDFLDEQAKRKLAEEQADDGA